MNYTEFRQSQKQGPRHFKVQNSWGVYDAYKTIRKRRWMDIGKRVTEKEFYAIIRGINKLLIEDVTQGKTVMFPKRMGELELRKYKVGTSFANGKLINTYPVDWKATLELWSEDSEARKKKILIRIENPEIYYIKYCTSKANYDNKVFYKFTLCDAAKKQLSKNIKEKKTDTLW